MRTLDSAIKYAKERKLVEVIGGGRYTKLRHLDAPVKTTREHAAKMSNRIKEVKEAKTSEPFLTEKSIISVIHD